MASQTYETGGTTDFFKRWKNGDLSERHRREKVSRFHARLMPLVDPSSEMGDPLADRSFSATPLKYIAQKLSPEDFERYAERELARFAPLPQAEIERAVDEMRRPALFLDKTPTPDATGAAGCWLGGLPTLPATVNWPWFRFGGADLVPMDFLAQINLAELPRNPAFPKCPRAVHCFFSQQGWLIMPCTALTGPHCVA